MRPLDIRANIRAGIRSRAQTAAAVSFAAIAAIATAAPATAGETGSDNLCSQQVADAFAKQRNSSAFRLKAMMINERGVVHMNVDYQLPDRMHQRVKAVVDPAATETILVGPRAWVTNGSGWQALPLEDTEEIAKIVRETVVEAPKMMSKFDCLGIVSVDGRQLSAYQAMEDKTAPKNSPIRIVYVDPTTGLPARSVVAPEGNPDRPFVRQDYSYPTDIKIDPPADVK